MDKRKLAKSAESDMSSDGWREMHDILKDSELNTAAVNVLLRHYDNLKDVVSKGAYHLSASRGCGQKTFEEIADYLFRHSYTSERWNADTIAKDRNRLSETEHKMLNERFIGNMTMEQIAVKHHITKQMVSDILRRANAKAARLYIIKEAENNDY